MKKLVFDFPTSAIARHIVDLMTTNHVSEFIYASCTGSKVVFITDFPKRTRIAVKEVENQVENA